MTIDETTSLLPKEYQKTHIIPIPQDDENNNLSSNNNNADDNGVLREYDSYALTKDELNKFIGDPWWIKMRYGCFAICWIVCLIALAISLYIAADALQHDHCGVIPATDNDVNHTQTPLPATVSEATEGALSIVGSATAPSSVVFALLTQQTT
uniref:Solute carrier family 3 member 2 N-terminal domain-containing protein n=1 Tax=Anopheles atroparvus TaxID=41427 RepID=A0AAG5CVW1_ANOAO